MNIWTPAIDSIFNRGMNLYLSILVITMDLKYRTSMKD